MDRKGITSTLDPAPKKPVEEGRERGERERSPPPTGEFEVLKKTAAQIFWWWCKGRKRQKGEGQGKERTKMLLGSACMYRLRVYLGRASCMIQLSM